ncbi:MAG: hypothetical protein [Microvirus sp.]|nr:MAG: hypothetical protein [Microvirus sp.]
MDILDVNSTGGPNHPPNAPSPSITGAFAHFPRSHPWPNATKCRREPPATTSRNTPPGPIARMWPVRRDRCAAGFAFNRWGLPGRRPRRNWLEASRRLRRGRRRTSSITSWGIPNAAASGRKNCGEPCPATTLIYRRSRGTPIFG